MAFMGTGSRVPHKLAEWVATLAGVQYRYCVCGLNWPCPYAKQG